MSNGVATAAHTPGPWRAVVDVACGHVDDIIAADGTHVVCFGHDYDDYGGIFARSTGQTPEAIKAWVAEIEANARLIAAAPDLLASVREFVALYEGVSDMVSAPVLAKIERARVAIAKAEERS